ncbi:IS3 family transposase [Mariniflexile gromovii]|uniref:IS3 family transposase n=1 Tax=Mariniflexile gromovii TaxID=362523 RepID=A0ABS4C019_9FLAO|nr:IS3 family transposase [Mariniflexile gromovii]
MKKNNWLSKHKRKFKATTDSNRSYPFCRNLLNRNFNPRRLNEAWVSDITYIQTNQGWLSLTTIIDLFDRQAVGWSLSISLNTNQTIVPAWKMAISNRKTNMDLIFHSDRGIQYASKTFIAIIESNTLVTQSMSRRANYWDNAVAESFFKTFKSRTYLRP